MASEDCSCCRYFQIGFGDRIGLCRRYPTFQNRSVSEWCGEFSIKQPTIVALPVVEMPQIDEKSVETPREKRKYTRRNNAETSA